MTEILTQTEAETIAKHTVEASDRPLTQEEVESVIAWAFRVRVEHTMLELLLDGAMVPVVPEKPGDPLKWRDAAKSGGKARGR